jgi:hypothetical protein
LWITALLILVLTLLFTLQASKRFVGEALGYKKLKEMLRGVYSAPDMTMSKLKLERLPVSEFTVSVKVSGIESPGSKTVLGLSQVRVR